MKKIKSLVSCLVSCLVGCLVLSVFCVGCNEVQYGFHIDGELPEGFPYDFGVVNQNKNWFGTHRNALFAYNKETKEFKWFHEEPVAPSPWVAIGQTGMKGGAMIASARELRKIGQERNTTTLTNNNRLRNNPVIEGSNAAIGDIHAPSIGDVSAIAEGANASVGDVIATGEGGVVGDISNTLTGGNIGDVTGTIIGDGAEVGTQRVGTVEIIGDKNKVKDVEGEIEYDD